MENINIENTNIENAAKEMIEIVRKYNFALGEFDRATYKVRDYFNKHARLPEVVENLDEDVEEHSK